MPREALLENGFPEKSIDAAIALIDAIHETNMKLGRDQDVEPLLDDILANPGYYEIEGGYGTFAHEEFLEFYGPFIPQIHALVRALR
jgi:hypothetical protein